MTINSCTWKILFLPAKAAWILFLENFYTNCKEKRKKETERWYYFPTGNREKYDLNTRVTGIGRRGFLLSQHDGSKKIHAIIVLTCRRRSVQGSRDTLLTRISYYRSFVHSYPTGMKSGAGKIKRDLRSFFFFQLFVTSVCLVELKFWGTERQVSSRRVSLYLSDPPKNAIGGT